MPWLSDLNFGEKMEMQYLSHTNHKSYKKIKGNFKDYDLEITDNNDKIHTIEIKADRQTRNTGNIFIEFECNGKPSGITTSKADLWAYFENYPTLESQNRYNDEVKDKKLNFFQKKNYETKFLEFENNYTLYEVKKDELLEMIKSKKYNRIYTGIIEGIKVKGYLFSKKLFENNIIKKYFI